MRWTDLPADGSPGDGGASGLRRGEWEALRQRLERLPAGHPSAPDDEESEDEEQDVDPAARSSRPADADDSDRDRPADPERRPAGGRPPQGADGEPRTGASDSHRTAPAARHAPYRPWFASGESPQPWFTGDE
jgi:hypothetical protein